MKAALLLLALVLGGGCAAPAVKQQKDRSAIQQRLDEVFAAAKAKDWARLDSYHAYGPGFTKFGSEAPGRQDEHTAREGEHKSLGSIEGLEISAQELKIDIFGKTAVTTSILRSKFNLAGEARDRSGRATLVFIKEAGQWKIIHEHISPIPNP